MFNTLRKLNKILRTIEANEIIKELTDDFERKIPGLKITVPTYYFGKEKLFNIRTNIEEVCGYSYSEREVRSYLNGVVDALESMKCKCSAKIVEKKK